MSFRWRRCASPWRIRIELAPANGSRNAALSPPWSTSGGAAYTRLISAGSETSTSGASDHAVRSVNGSPWRACARRSSAVGRAIHSTVCNASGSRGPGGSGTLPMIADSAQRATPAEAGLARGPGAAGRLAHQPAQVALVAAEQRREVDQPPIEIPDDYVHLLQLVESERQLERRGGVLDARPGTAGELCQGGELAV